VAATRIGDYTAALSRRWGVCAVKIPSWGRWASSRAGGSWGSGRRGRCTGRGRT